MFHKDTVKIPSTESIYHIKKNFFKIGINDQYDLSEFPKCHCRVGSKCNDTQHYNISCYFECGSNCPYLCSCENNCIYNRK